MPLSDDELKQAVVDALAGHTVLTMATLGETGPHAVSLMYAHKEFDLFWLSDPKASHSGHLESGGYCSVSIARQYDDFKNIMGLQMSGHGLRLKKGIEADDGFVLLTRRYPFLQKFTAGELARHLGRAALYRFRPDRITLIDNTRGFGFKQTLQLYSKP
jgi:uncharacterized protein YhbP (UPF0306 family)